MYVDDQENFLSPHIPNACMPINNILKDYELDNEFSY